MEAVELPPVGMSWARAGLPALGPPPLKKGRSRQELMQREAEFQRFLQLFSDLPTILCEISRHLLPSFFCQ